MIVVVVVAAVRNW